jgi:hypothetical protein
MQHLNGRQSTAVTNAATEDLGHRLAEWRKTHRAPSRIPKEFWVEAAGLAARYGVAPTARALRLDYAALKKRTQLLAAPKSTPTFLEWLSPTLDSIGDCALEVESPRGARLRIQVKSLSPAGLAAIIRDFAG